MNFIFNSLSTYSFISRVYASSGNGPLQRRKNVEGVSTSPMMKIKGTNEWPSYGPGHATTNTNELSLVGRWPVGYAHSFAHGKDFWRIKGAPTCLPSAYGGFIRIWGAWQLDRP